MNYSIIDFEYNQSFDFKKNDKGNSVPECPFEIIQIGSIKLNGNYEKIDEINLLIRPQVYERMHPYVEKITGINKKMLRDKDVFADNYEKFVEYLKGTTLCFWGGNDIKELYKNAAYYKLDYSILPKKFINVQSMASRFLKCPPGQTIGLKNAVSQMEIPISEDFHNALNDAFYTGEIFKRLKNKAHLYERVNMKFLHKNSESRGITFDIPALYRSVEKSFGRKLSRKEKNIFKSVYEMGREGLFDLKNEE